MFAFSDLGRPRVLSFSERLVQLSGKTVEAILVKLNMINLYAWEIFLVAMLVILEQGHAVTKAVKMLPCPMIK